MSVLSGIFVIDIFHIDPLLGTVFCVSQLKVSVSVERLVGDVGLGYSQLLGNQYQLYF